MLRNVKWTNEISLLLSDVRRCWSSRDTQFVNSPLRAQATAWQCDRIQREARTAAITSLHQLQTTWTLSVWDRRSTAGLLCVTWSRQPTGWFSGRSAVKSLALRPAVISSLPQWLVKVSSSSGETEWCRANLNVCLQRSPSCICIRMPLWVHQLVVFKDY